MRITIWIDKDGSVTISDCSFELYEGLVKKIGKRFEKKGVIRGDGFSLGMQNTSKREWELATKG